MMPLLTIYADLMGILGGYLVGTGLLDISPRAYIQQTTNAVNGELQLVNGFEAFADADLVAAVGGQPFAEEIAAIVAEIVVLACFFFSEIPYLWFNVIGCVVLIVVAHILNPMFPAERQST